MMRHLDVASYVLNNGPRSFFLWQDESRSESKLPQFMRVRVLIVP